MVYLNHDFKGGKTLFLDNNGYVKFSGIPKCGSAVVFTGETLHQAEPIISGSKYILRTEIIFKRVNCNQIPKKTKENYLNDPKYLQMKNLFNQSESFEISGDVENYTKTFVEGLELLVEKKTSISKQFEDDLLPNDIISLIIEYLSKKEIINIMLISKTWNYCSNNNNNLWKRFYLEEYKKVPSSNDFNSISNYWYSILKQRFSIENNFRSLVVLLDDTFSNFSINEEDQFYLPYEEYFGIIKPGN